MNQNNLDQRTHLVNVNFDFGRSLESQVRDFEEIKRTGIEILVGQEGIFNSQKIGQDWKMNRPNDPEKGAPGGPFIAWKKNRRVFRTGAPLASASTRGARMRLRRFPWINVYFPGIGIVRVISIHMPPKRYRGILYSVYAWNLRRILRNSRHPWLAGGDWNWFINEDPANLRKVFGAKWYGERIDGWAVHPDLVKHIEKFWVVLPPERKDRHRQVHLVFNPNK